MSDIFRLINDPLPEELIGNVATAQQQVLSAIGTLTKKIDIKVEYINKLLPPLNSFLAALIILNTWLSTFTNQIQPGPILDPMLARAVSLQITVEHLTKLISDLLNELKSANEEVVKNNSATNLKPWEKVTPLSKILSALPARVAANGDLVVLNTTFSLDIFTRAQDEC